MLLLNCSEEDQGLATDLAHLSPHSLSLPLSLFVSVDLAQPEVLCTRDWTVPLHTALNLLPYLAKNLLSAIGVLVDLFVSSGDAILVWWDATPIS
jgi:hypothetical protein